MTIGEQKPEVQFPFMRVQATPQGMVITVVLSQFKQEQTFIPQVNCIQFCIEFMAQLPHGTCQDIIKAMGEMKKQSDALAKAVTNPRGKLLDIKGGTISGKLA